MMTSGTRLLIRLGLLAAVPLMALGALAGHADARRLGPVSARTVLARADAALPAASPDRVFHQISTLSYTATAPATQGLPDRASTIEQWARFDDHNAVIQQATTITGATGALLTRTVQEGNTIRTYSAKDNTVTTFTLPPSLGGGIGMGDPFGVAYMRQLVRAAQNGSQNVRLLPQQTLDGVTVDVVSLNSTVPLSATSAQTTTAARTVTTTLYVGAHSYAIRGMDLSETGGAGIPTFAFSLRVRAQSVVALATVPAGAFAFNPPATARAVAGPALPQIRTLGVAAALGVSDAPLLTGDPDGLRLRRIESIGASRSIDYTYQAAHAPGDFSAPGFAVMVDPRGASSAAGAAFGATRALTLTVAGQTVQARYSATSTGLVTLRLLAYRQGAASVLLTGSGLDEKTFFATIGALVDGRARPDVAARLQQELDAAASSNNA